MIRCTRIAKTKQSLHRMWLFILYTSFNVANSRISKVDSVSIMHGICVVLACGPIYQTCKSAVSQQKWPAHPSNCIKFGDWAFSVAAPVAWNSLRRRSALSVAQQLLRTNLKRFSFTTFYNISVQYAFNSSLYFILIEIFIASELVSCVGKLFCQNWLIDWLI